MTGIPLPFVASASIAEESRTVYLLRVGRGGPADSESSVLVKIADMTARYGEDYFAGFFKEYQIIDTE